MFIYPDILYMIRDTGGFSCFKLEIFLFNLQFTPSCIFNLLLCISPNGERGAEDNIAGGQTPPLRVFTI